MALLRALLKMCLTLLSALSTVFSSLYPLLAGFFTVRQLAANRPSASSPLLDENVQFTVYRPKTVRPQQSYTLVAFAHLDELPPSLAEDQWRKLEENASEVASPDFSPAARQIASAWRDLLTCHAIRVDQWDEWLNALQQDFAQVHTTCCGASNAVSTAYGSQALEVLL